MFTTPAAVPMAQPPVHIHWSAPPRSPRYHSGSSSPRRRRFHDQSSDPFDAEITYPDTREWLAALDHGNRAIDGHRFTQYGPELFNRGYLRFNQIADMTDTKLINIFKESATPMNEGTAQLLTKYAKSDSKKFRRMGKL